MSKTAIFLLWLRTSSPGLALLYVTAVVCGLLGFYLAYVQTYTPFHFAETLALFVVMSSLVGQMML